MKKYVSYLPLIATILGAIALISLFMPAVEAGEESYKGINAVIGYSQSIMGFKVKVLEFSVMNLVPYVLVLVGIACASSMRKSTETKSAWVGAVCFIVAGVMFFMAPNFLQLSEELEAMGVEGSDFDSAIGATLAAVVSILAGAAMIVAKVMNKGEVVEVTEEKAE